MRTDYDIKVIYDVDELRRLGKWPEPIGSVPTNPHVMMGRFKPSELEEGEKLRLLAIDQEFDKLLEELDSA